jgi:hypothetical protein
MRSAPSPLLLSALFLAAGGLGLPACGLFFPQEGDTDDDGDTETLADPVFVAVGDQGAVLSSPDGATWSVRTSGTTLALNDVTFGGDRYVAVGQAGKILVSDDGLEWTSASSPSSRDLNAVVWHIDRFYAIGGDYSAGAETLVSFDGNSWTRPEITQPKHLLTDLASDGVNLVTIGSYQSDLQSFGLFAWAEGSGWVQRIDGASAAVRYDVIAAGIPNFVMINLGAAASSTDTITWNATPIFNGGVMLDLAYTSVGWLAVGDNGLILGSPDARAWTPHPTGLPVALRGVGSDGGLNIAVGAGGTILGSGDGAGWTAIASPITTDLRAVTHPRG